MKLRMMIIFTLIGVVLGLGKALPACAERYSQAVTLVGPAEPTGISGFSGSTFAVGVPDSRADEYALFGISSEERRDNPCYVTIKTENINDSGQPLELKKALCGGKERSSEMKAEFKNAYYPPRTFVTRVKVCLNNQNSRVKGIKLHGQIIKDDGELVDVKPSDIKGPEKKSGLDVILDTEPEAFRAHCNDNWKPWAQCPAGQIATAAILHFDAGNEPRSLTGVALKCRRVALPGTAAVRAQ